MLLNCYLTVVCACIGLFALHLIYHPPAHPTDSQMIVHVLLLDNRPEWCRFRLSHTLAPGETEQHAALRWRRVVVSWLAG